MPEITVRNESSGAVEAHVSTHDPGARLFSWAHQGNAFWTVGMQSEVDWDRDLSKHCVTVKHRGRDYEVHGISAPSKLVVRDQGIFDGKKIKVAFDNMRTESDGKSDGNTCPANGSKAHEFVIIEFDNMEIDKCEEDWRKVQTGVNSENTLGGSASQHFEAGGFFSKFFGSENTAGGGPSGYLNMGARGAQQHAVDEKGLCANRVRGKAAVCVVCKHCMQTRVLRPFENRSLS